MKHRPDIDGLRTLAIVPVVLFHADITAFSGGFTGVDIFFVISGFLITSLILEDIGRGRFSILAFYKRRALRILPAYIAMLLGVIVVSYFILLPEETRVLGRSMIAASTFVSNIYFWQKAGYFAEDSDSELLLHTWTLSVEEQYYILLPIFLVLVSRYFASRYVMAIALVSVVSFLISIWGIATWREVPTFYLLPTRAWEFGLGSLVAAGVGRDVAPGQWKRTLGAGLGAALLGYAVFGLDSGSDFPGPNALFPTMGALLLIICAEGTWAARILASAPFVAIGKISYSLYLWHWPIIVFYKMRFGPTLEWPDAVAVVALSTGAAALSYRWVEQPFRAPAIRARPAWAVNGLAVSTLGASVVLGMALIVGAERWGGHPAEVRRIADYIDYSWEMDVSDCFIHANTPGGYGAFDEEACLAPSKTEPTMLIVGDSFAEHLLSAFKNRFPEFNVQAASASGCRPLIDVEGDWYCPRLMNRVLEKHITKGGVDSVILSARWIEGETAPLKATIAHLSRYVDRIVILGRSPEYIDSFPKLLARSLPDGAQNLERFLDPAAREMDQRMRHVDWGDKVRYVSMYDLICPRDECRLFTRERVPLLADYGHFTHAAAKEVVAELAARGVLRRGTAGG